MALEAPQRRRDVLDRRQRPRQQGRNEAVDQHVARRGDRLGAEQRLVAATISPQPSTPSASIRTSGTTRASMRPKLVSKGRTSVSEISRISIDDRRTGAAAARVRVGDDVPANVMRGIVQDWGLGIADCDTHDRGCADCASGIGERGSSTPAAGTRPASLRPAVCVRRSAFCALHSALPRYSVDA